MKPAGSAALMAGLAALLASAVDASAASGARADLKIATVAAPAAPAMTGARLAITVSTRNAGRVRAKSSISEVYLSRDSRQDRSDSRLGTARVPALNARRTSRRTIIVLLPSDTAPGTYRMLACADAPRRIKERNERNNCRAMRRALVVQAPFALPGGPIPATPPAAAPSPGAEPTPAQTAEPTPTPTPTPVADDDGDGFTNAADCAPTDPTVSPGAPDPPDVPTFADTNCDGLDGDASRGVFVSPAGSDAAPGTRTQPKRTFAAAVPVALGRGDDVYAMAGIYAERLDVANGVSVYGGYESGWSRSLAAQTEITGALSPAGMQGAVAIGATGPTTLQLLRLGGASTTVAGVTSYALRAYGSPGLIVERVKAIAVAGTPGMAGAPGVAGRPGGRGVDGGAGTCSGFATDNGGGAGGPSLTGRTGGAGGYGGLYGGMAGYPGAPGESVDAGGGPGGDGGATGDPGASGFDGENGDSGTKGADGAGGWSGTVESGAWRTRGGTAGANGADGHGGGGGGGGGGQDYFDPSDGAGNGGGGGGGGAEGGTGGGGGAGGGGSFGIFMDQSSGAVIRNSAITARNGARGGSGAGGGSVGVGGLGGLGATNCNSEVGAGGNGGDGGFGGRGGDGAGGAGGPSIALYTTPGTAVTAEGNTLAFGTGGAAGGATASAGIAAATN